MIDLSGKTALITGGSRGIGSACVKLFAKAGCNVAFTYHKDYKAANELTESIKDEVKIKSYKTDLLDETNILETVDKVLLDFGSIDILVNNAGIWQHGPIEELSLADWKNTIDANLTGTYLFSKNVIPGMKENNFGRIINVSSTAGQRGEAEYSHYAASKGGVISFTKSLASELGPFGITVNSVAPGWVDTDMVSGVFANAEYKKGEAEKIPVRRIATAEDIAGPILFLSSEFARHVNGEILNVNGGSILCG